jgi:hypothetical protein
MSVLPQADKEQCAAFIVSLPRTFIHFLLLKPVSQRDERVLVIWSDSFHNIVRIYRDLEQKMINLLRRTPRPSSTLGTDSPSISYALSRDVSGIELSKQRNNQHEEKANVSSTTKNASPPPEGQSTTEVGDTEDQVEKRPVQLFAPIYIGLSAGLALGALTGLF